MLSYIAITMNYWGKGTTPTDAIKSMRKAGGRTNEQAHGYVVLETDDPDAEIDQISGGVSVEHGKTAKVIVDKRKKKAR